jgi:predicted hotdog family 3-hydroxylacyl-ACP dehydratase
MSARTSLETLANVRGGRFSMRMLLLLELERWNGRYAAAEAEVEPEPEAELDDDDMVRSKLTKMATKK